jgi:hypothetical protein
MTWSNVPDDWNYHWQSCPDCDELYHASEPHDCSDEPEPEGCADCGADGAEHRWGETHGGEPWLICGRCLGRHLALVDAVRLAVTL